MSHKSTPNACPRSLAAPVRPTNDLHQTLVQRSTHPKRARAHTHTDIHALTRTHLVRNDKILLVPLLGNVQHQNVHPAPQGKLPFCPRNTTPLHLPVSLLAGSAKLGHSVVPHRHEIHPVERLLFASVTARGMAAAGGGTGRGGRSNGPTNERAWRNKAGLQPTKSWFLLEVRGAGSSSITNACLPGRLVRNGLFFLAIDRPRERLLYDSKHRCTIPFDHITRYTQLSTSIIVWSTVVLTAAVAQTAKSAASHQTPTATGFVSAAISNTTAAVLAI